MEKLLSVLIVFFVLCLSVITPNKSIASNEESGSQNPGGHATDRPDPACAC